MKGLKKQEDKGVLYHHYTTTESSAGIMAIGESKTVMRGNLKVTLTQNSYKYGSELQFRIIKPKDRGDIEIKSRNKSNWDTVEINVPINELNGIITALMQFRALQRKGQEVKTEQKRLKNV